MLLRCLLLIAIAATLTGCPPMKASREPAFATATGIGPASP